MLVALVLLTLSAGMEVTLYPSIEACWKAVPLVERVVREAGVSHAGIACVPIVAVAAEPGQPS